MVTDKLKQTESLRKQKLTEDNSDITPTPKQSKEEEDEEAAKGWQQDGTNLQNVA